jgi:hypothetical protein
VRAAIDWQYRVADWILDFVLVLRAAGATAGKNKNGRNAEARRPFWKNGEVELEGLDVRGLQALGALGHFEFNSLAIVQTLVAISHNGGEMDENVLAGLALNEAVALAGVEPLHCSLFFTHCFYSFLSAVLRLSISN